MKTNDRHGRLTCLDPYVAMTIKGRAYKGLYECECGNQKIVLNCSVASGHAKSCGCISREGAFRRRGEKSHLFKDGRCRTKTWSSWKGMINRCTYPSDKSYKYYGGRGITIHEDWRVFENFRRDLGDRLEGTTLDRIDNNGNYEPGNCRWSTYKEQSNNRRKKGMLYDVN